MKMSEIDINGPQPPIQGYGPDGFRIGGAYRTGAILLAPGGITPWPTPWPASLPAALNAAAAAPLAALKGEIDILLIGLGPDLAEVPAAFRAALAPLEAEASGFGVDFMATPAACRTYNVLLTEQRRAAAALLPIGGG